MTFRFFFSLLLLAPLGLAAQSPSASDGAWHVESQVAAESIASAMLSDDSSRYGSTRSGLSLSLLAPPRETLTWGVTGAYGRAWNRHTRVDDSLIDNWESLDLGLQMGWREGPWSLRSQARMKWGRESGVPFGKGRTTGFTVTGGYAFSPVFQLYLGLLAQERLEQDWRILPLPGILWRFHPQWMLRTANGATLSYFWGDPGDAMTDLSLLWQSESFRLRGDRDATLASAALEERFFRAQVSHLLPLPHGFYLRASAGVDFERRFQVHKSNENLETIRTNAALVVGLETGLTF